MRICGNMGRDLYVSLFTEIQLIVIPSLNFRVKEDESFKKAKLFIVKYNTNTENS